jgi:hypothetical protein
MGKRSNFDRVPRDFYPTPEMAVVPLLPHLETKLYIEPCAGDGTLIDHLTKFDKVCYAAYDIEPQRSDIKKADVLQFDWSQFKDITFITNPPWDRKILHPLITTLSDVGPTWLLFDASWAHTAQSRPFLDRLVKIVSVGRVKWFPGSTMAGKDDCAWYLFDRPDPDRKTIFIGR